MTTPQASMAVQALTAGSALGTQAEEELDHAR
eukprot:CAMPEP_0115527990 /NCGR_PEP_ID=MMETSP0271-20121206/83153_1 /TAXON_ID=71861 /ORGANISM="Scrippsiella trochoidea, Strain CCMP3099" /LENGTH=31 /DNA_ID= /DNA_START= /DNA_END= /DNA_ORIENTATION=